MTRTDRDPIPVRQFNISPKTPNALLVQGRSFAAGADQRRVATDIVTNARELEPGIDWSEVLNHVQVVSGSRRCTGEFAVLHGFSATVGSVAAKMGWDMHSPEVVYQSGYLPFWALTKDLDRLNTRIQETKAGTRMYVDETARAATLARDRQDAPRLGLYRRKLGEALYCYSVQELDGDDLYKKILQGLLFAGHSGMKPTIRVKVLDSLKQGNREVAAALVENSFGGIEPLHDFARRMGLFPSTEA